MLAIIDTHPIQYRAPVYRTLSELFGIPITVIYGSDFSIVGYKDQEFGVKFAWDIDLLSGYTSEFLSQVKTGGAQSFETVSAPGITAVLQKIQPKALLITGYNHPFYRAVLYEVWKAKYPIIFRGETTDHAQKRSPFKGVLRDSILYWMYRQFAKTLYIGQHSKDHFQRLGCSQEQLVFSPYCISTSFFQCSEDDRSQLRHVTRQSLGITDDQIVLLFSGKLSSRKRPDLLLQAVKQLPLEVRTQIVILFLGDGEMKSSLENLAQISPAVTVHFLGFQNQSQLSPYYHTADFLVLPSDYSETWGLVVNEALHHGLPAIVSQAVGCAPDLINPGVTGEVFATGSVESLTQAIERSRMLIGRPDIREQCRQKVSDYSVEKAAAGIVRAYRETIR
ncbi:glycosyltransferase [Nostoc sp. 'Peltigera membranacea cyanobiont' 213]|uniref:glycosyltransferase family 4 protein n=1 Tax=Nostoc sp. 'Peltigera membranacea cyanobiont' 213 TaxID=2014530 RepID=UPI000B952BFC|nr:glycosyltransferase family 4 protein [Nostoc sp. 'Peltigera membranacea cyanobiont' 213]OYD99141.1 glycosyltransferase [Nostoc sp. 'Peltigera membranacea cyanobiont' 213]